MTTSFYPGRAFGAFLFDMDGTILSSIAATERVWSSWGRRYQLDLETFLPTIHGVRASETIARLNLPGVDAQAEADILLQAELEDVGGIEPIAGAAAFLASLPADRWAVVTSAPRELARRRLGAAGLPLPPLMVSGEDVTKGKPAPDCFRLAAAKLGQRPEDCLVFEDAAAGIQAAEAAGASLMVVTATHAHSSGTIHPTLASYDGLRVLADGSGRLMFMPAAVAAAAAVEA